MKEITVVLGGGAALGYAHIGVLKELEKSFKIKRIIGTSMGALVGALYSSGMTPNDIYEFGKTFKYLEFINPFNLDIRFQGVIDGSFIEKRVNDRLKSKNIETFPIKFSAVAFDLNSRRTIVLDKGKVGRCCRASAAIPYIFNPVKIDSFSLVDGGIEYPLPLLDINREKEFVVAVNVLPSVHNVITHISESNKYEVSQPKREKKWFDIIIESINCNQSFLVTQLLKTNTPDIYIDCAVESVLPAEFNKIDELVKLGEETAQEVLNSINIS
jgi:NTE family protein